MNKKIIEDYMEEVWNKKNLSVIDEVFDESALIHSPLGQLKTSAEMLETVKEWINAIPDIKVELLHTLEENGIVVSHWKATGTHKSDLNGRQASGNPVSYHGVTMYRLENGKVKEYWAYLDSWSLEKQMQAN